jgi:hypothetical protein
VVGAGGRSIMKVKGIKEFNPFSHPISASPAGDLD